MAPGLSRLSALLAVRLGMKEGFRSLGKLLRKGALLSRAFLPARGNGLCGKESEKQLSVPSVIYTSGLWGAAGQVALPPCERGAPKPHGPPGPRS